MNFLFSTTFPYVFLLLLGYAPLAGNKYQIWAAIHHCVSLQSAISHRLLVRHKKRAKITKVHPFDL